MSNSERYPEAWAFYIEHARNMGGTEFEIDGKYRIPVPDMKTPIEYIHTDTVEMLWSQFISRWYREDLNSPSLHGKIQYIVNNF